MAMQTTVQPSVSWTPTRKQFTVEEYYRLGEIGVIGPDERTELIEGEIYTMAPIGCYHNATVLKINRVFSSLFLKQAIVSVQSPIRMRDKSEPEPDVMLLHLKDSFYADAHPTPEEVYLIVEVSETPLEYDRNTKLPVYAKAMIPEVWIVDIEHDTIEKYTNPNGEQYQNKTVFKKGEMLTVDVFNENQIEVNAVLPEKTKKES